MSNESEAIGGSGPTLPYKTCQHIKDNGIRCGSPAVSGRMYCHFHFRATDELSSPGDPGYVLPVLDTEQSIQIALQQMTRSLLSGKLSERKAGVMMSAIRTAAQLIRQTSQNAPKEALMAEIASELRGRLATEISSRKPAQSVAERGWHDPALAQH